VFWNCTRTEIILPQTAHIPGAARWLRVGQVVSKMITSSMLLVQF
jgi:hypothetical protein